MITKILAKMCTDTSPTAQCIHVHEAVNRARAGTGAVRVYLVLCAGLAWNKTINHDLYLFLYLFTEVAL